MNPAGKKLFEHKEKREELLKHRNVTRFRCRWPLHISQILVIFDLSKSRNYQTTGIEAFEHKSFALLVDCVSSSILPPIISLKIVEDEVLCPTFCGDRRNHQRGKVEMFGASVCFPIIVPCYILSRQSSSSTTADADP